MELEVVIVLKKSQDCCLRMRHDERGRINPEYDRLQDRTQVLLLCFAPFGFDDSFARGRSLKELRRTWRRTSYMY